MSDDDRRFSNAFPDAEELRRWHRLTPEEQEAELRATLEEGLNGPASPITTKNEIMARVLARYAVEA